MGPRREGSDAAAVHAGPAEARQGRPVRGAAPVAHQDVPRGAPGVAALPDGAPVRQVRCLAMLSIINALLLVVSELRLQPTKPQGDKLVVSAAHDCHERLWSYLLAIIEHGLRLNGRIPLLFIVAITYRLRYYFAWAVSESSLIFAGLSYNGLDPATGRPRWDRCINARIEKVQINTCQASVPCSRQFTPITCDRHRIDIVCCRAFVSWELVSWELTPTRFQR